MPQGIDDDANPRFSRARRVRLQGAAQTRVQRRRGRVIGVAGQPAVVTVRREVVLVDRLGQDSRLAEAGWRYDECDPGREAMAETIKQPRSDKRPPTEGRRLEPNAGTHGARVRSILLVSE